MRPSIIRIIIKDSIDFLLIFIISTFLTYGIYLMLPSFMPVDLSFYFFEQFFELFFINQRLVLWFLGLSFGVTIIYFLFCSMLHKTTIGGMLMSLLIVDNKKQTPANLLQVFFLAIFAYVGTVLFLLSPLYAWWLNANHRGLAELCSKTMVIKKT